MINVTFDKFKDSASDSKLSVPSLLVAHAPYYASTGNIVIVAHTIAKIPTRMNSLGASCCSGVCFEICESSEAGTRIHVGCGV